LKTENGVMKMRSLSDGLQVDLGQTLTLKPGGYHIMFVGLNKPMKQGEHAPVTLEFANAGKVNVEFVVEAVGATQGGDQGMSSMPGMKHSWIKTRNPKSSAYMRMIC